MLIAVSFFAQHRTRSRDRRQTRVTRSLVHREPTGSYNRATVRPLISRLHSPPTNQRPPPLPFPLSRHRRRISIPSWTLPRTSSKGSSNRPGRYTTPATVDTMVSYMTRPPPHATSQEDADGATQIRRERSGLFALPPRNDWSFLADSTTNTNSQTTSCPPRDMRRPSSTQGLGRTFTRASMASTRIFSRHTGSRRSTTSRATPTTTSSTSCPSHV